MKLPLLFLSAISLATCQSTGGGNGTVVTGKMGDARAVKNNPVGETWVATFDGSQGVKGTFTAVGWTLGVNYTLDVTGLPEGKGPFSMFFFSFLSLSFPFLS